VLKPHETTSGSLWHAREVELVRMASKNHESPLRLGIAYEPAREMVAKRTLFDDGADDWMRGA